MPAPSDTAAAHLSPEDPASGLTDARHLRLLSRARLRDEDLKEANATLATGLGIGAFGAASLAIFGATCPLCVVAAPVLISLGWYKRFTATRRR
jgi:hypothetical protein